MTATYLQVVPGTFALRQGCTNYCRHWTGEDCTHHFRQSFWTVPIDDGCVWHKPSGVLAVHLAKEAKSPEDKP